MEALLTKRYSPADFAPHNRYHHLTLILDKGRVLAVGRNDEKSTHPLAKKYGYWGCVVHSELAAIVKLRGTRVPRRASIFNIRVDKHGTVRHSKPCAKCQRLLRDYGVRQVKYTTDTGGTVVMDLD